MECYETSFLNLNKNIRIDSEYWLKKYVNNEKFITGLPLNYYCSSESILNIREKNNIDNFEYVEISGVNQNPITYISNTISFEEIPSRATYVLKHKDIVVSTVRPNRNSVAYINNFGLQVGTSGFCVLRIDENAILPEYVLAFCKSKYFVTKLERESTATMYPAVTDDDIFNVKILAPSFEKQILVADIVKKAVDLVEQSKLLYRQAEEILEKELGIDYSAIEQKKDVESSVRSFKDVFCGDMRIDSEYYLTKYDELLKQIKSVEFKTINQLQTFNRRGLQPEYFADGTIDVVNSKHILEDGLDYDNFEKTSESFYSKSSQAWIYRNDILTYTTGANIGRTQVYLSDAKAVASNHVNILRVNSVNPIYLAFVLNSKVGRMQTDKYCSGTAQVELYPEVLGRFIVPILDEEIQLKIASLVQLSTEKKAESKQLLEDAKRLVEEEIEKGG